MHIYKNLLIIFFGLIIFSARGQVNVNSDSLLVGKHPDPLLIIPENRLHAAALIFTTNMGVWSFDHFIAQAPYARINFNTIKSNIKTGFVWDNDMFVTNLFAHPYHGGLYFNAARSNGLNFWQSAPFTTGGSLMWEFCMENESPSINDVLATSFGGICLGEMNFRISDMIIDDRTMGFNRFKREALLMVVSPIRGLNRLIRGDAWKHRRTKGNSIPAVPTTFYSTIGHRIIADDLKNKEDISNMLCLDLGLYYGNPYDPDNEKPYDFFQLKLGGNLFSEQPLISRASALGMLYCRSIALRKSNHQLALGFFQHFNYYESKTEINNASLSSYKISEAASVGPGILHKIKFKNHMTFSSSAYLSAILLGGSQTDHYKFDERDYNMGSGFSSKLNLDLQFGNNIRIFLNSEDYRIYSWLGDDPNDPDNTSTSVQGDKGNASLSVANLGFSFTISGHFLLEAETGYYYRRSIYSYYPDVEHSVTENKVSVGYIF